jgi:hypothetical protein
MRRRHSRHVMAGPVPAIHAVRALVSEQAWHEPRHVDGRDKPGHDGEKGLPR